MSSTPLRLGTRGSELALWQARYVATLIGERLGRSCEIVIIKTEGDRVLDVAFHKMEGKGFFTKELQNALLQNRIDLIVHSLKDVPTDEPPGLEIVAVVERHSTSDLLLARKGLIRQQPADPIGLPGGSVLGTSSLRRASQSLALSPYLKIKALRGNVPTRIDKLRSGEFDAILLAAAGVGRLETDLGDLDVLDLPPEVMLPAPGQGALAIERREDDANTSFLGKLQDQRVADCVGAERRLLQLLEGGCHLPLGTLATIDDRGIRLQAVLGDIDDDITRAVVSRVGAFAPDPETVAQACYRALQLALPSIEDP
jgi:hydroxymethylbilane synthase